ncbi:hypothetical protein RJ639_002274 [Escallonia herrerae]|uniref:Formin-like protein n=1 Tax=Escallonia herrerae TaxID=1293975 RepID=A0AA88X9A0_9ASTE|nr:hypothetical protein RJ639_002274 [Escallonia herrerae]
MDHGSQNLHMILFIIFLLISLNCTHTLIVDASLNAAEQFGVHGQKEAYHTQEKSGDEREYLIEKVSGEDEKEVFVLEKFRTLLGFKIFSIRRPSRGRSDHYGSPSPSPSPSPEAEAPAPVILKHVHSHPRRHRSHLLPRLRRIPKEEREQGSVRRTLVAILVPSGAVFVLSILGIIWGCRRFRKQRRRSTTTVSIIHSTEGGTRSRSKYVSSQVKKVNSDPGPDPFYLDSIGTALEPQPYSIKINSGTLDRFVVQNTSDWTLHEAKETEKQVKRSEHDNVSSSAVGEILTDHETAESIEYKPDGCSSPSGCEVIPVEAHSSDDESFHSFCDSHSSNRRVSSASAGSLGDTLESLSTVSKEDPSSVGSPRNLPIPLQTLISKFQPQPSQGSCSARKSILTGPCSSNTRKSLAPLPSLPPPPSVSGVRLSPSLHSSCSTQVAAEGLSFGASPDMTLSRSSDSSSGSNQTPDTDCSTSPPKTLGGIPPPPSPPSFPKGSSVSPNGPPPPPPQLPQHTPLGKDGAPLPKLKPLHWDKVRATPDHSMVWDKLRSSSFEFDEEMIKSLFGYNLQNSMKNDEVKRSPSPGKHVLEPKRLQNITILSKALNMTAEQVCHSLIQGGGLCLQQLEALVKIEPTKEEEAKLSSYKGNMNELGSAENFVMAILKIPHAFQRIEAMLYRDTFEDEVDDLRQSFSMLEEACKELRSSRLFLKLLEAVLKTGNRMNVGTIRGGAKAFKLDALLKLADVKGTDGKTTLLHFVVQEIGRSEGIRVSESIMGKISQKGKSKKVEDMEEDYRRMGLDLVSGLCTELCNVKRTATIDLDVLASSVSNLSDGMAKLQRLVSKDLCSEERSKNFLSSMRSFLNYAESDLKKLQEDEHRVLLHVRQITEYFHGDVSKDEANPLRIFVIVRDFLGMLDHVCRELRSLKLSTNSNPLAPFR